MTSAAQNNIRVGPHIPVGSWLGVPLVDIRVAAWTPLVCGAGSSPELDQVVGKCGSLPLSD